MRKSIVALLAIVLVTLAAPIVAPAQAAGPATDPAPYAAASFKPRPSDPARLTRAWNTWRAQGVRTYATIVELNCFCVPQRPIRTEVEGRTVTSVTYEGRQRQLHRHGYEMPELFLLLRDAFAEADEVDVRFNKRGVPVSIFIDSDVLIADEEYGLSVKLTRR